MADENDVMTTDQVAEHLGTSRSVADKWLRRRGIEPCGRQRGRTGQNLFPRARVEQAVGPGRGYRTDLHGPPDTTAPDTDS